MKPISNHVEQTSLVNKGSITWAKSELLLARPRRELELGVQDTCRPAWVANPNSSFASFCLLADSAI